MLEREQEISGVDHEGEAHAWRETLSEIGRKRANFQELAAEGLMTKEELSSKLDTLALAREAAERELKLASERSERLSALENDAERLLEAYEKRCVEDLADLSPEEETVQIVFDDGSARSLASSTTEGQEFTDIARKLVEARL